MKFQCLEECGGKCCKTPKEGQAFVFLTEIDMSRLSNFLNLPWGKFAQCGLFTETRFSPKPIATWFLRNGGGDCQFLKDGKCQVYEARPTQCRTFPFWPELDLKKTAEFCPGISEGEPSLTDLQKRSDQMRADEELCNNRY